MYIKVIVFMILGVALFSAPDYVLAADSPESYSREDDQLRQMDKYVPDENVHRSVTYRRRLRDLEKMYKQGSLTRTEYIQRRRHLNQLYS